jgi:hypothetical protein
MADIRNSFPTMEDSSQVGVVLSASQEGDAAAGKNGSVGFAFKDSTGDLILPQLSAGGNIPVEFTDSGVPKSGSSAGAIAGSLTAVTVAEATLSLSKTYKRISMVGACFKEAIFDIVQKDDATETILASGLVGAGEYTINLNLGDTQFSSGASGVQKIILKGYNLSKVSDLRGSIVCVEY